ncbi:transcriptional regulator of yeast form adherence 6-like [Lecanosticta acicola]|uniref:Transcriptional regulator of yeast form adherence 6-like n=1 Tax=Lecanosticta acicola TaxID=111012 RepID=A0AAI8Z039_9PEZI|nr:transcriptional regulator of yeast form adherence 6-like [Lecanosticta acicola]
MPRPNPPLTPGPSSDIRGKEGPHAAPAFHLPPTAYHAEQDRASTSSATPSANGSDSSYRPVSPKSPADMARKRPAVHQGSVITKDDFALPPPPTRSRKIIQMKPREAEQHETPPAAVDQTTGKAQPQAGGKRKQNNAGSTAAGRKIARKTAHSLIERRRRSKMNEEFGVLKDMIPACKGQEMHKLAILQASIDYLRYLEQCVADLQAQNNSPRPPPPPSTISRAQGQDEEDDEDEEMEDEQEAGAGTSTPATLEPCASAVSLPSLSHITTTTTTTTTSPSIFSAGAGRHYSISSAASSYSPYFHSNQASPAFGPQLHHVSTAPTFSGAFGLGSPALKPVDSSSHLRQIAEGATELTEKQRSAPNTARREHELDQEATAALLMLNHDRRNWRAAHETETSRSSTGMSVKDLLSG